VLFTLALYLQQGLGKSAAYSGLALVSWGSGHGRAGYPLPVYEGSVLSCGMSHAAAAAASRSPVTCVTISPSMNASRAAAAA